MSPNLLGRLFSVDHSDQPNKSVLAVHGKDFGRFRVALIGRQQTVLDHSIFPEIVVETLQSVKEGVWFGVFRQDQRQVLGKGRRDIINIREYDFDTSRAGLEL